MSKIPNWVLNLGMTMAGIVIGISIGEIGLRMANIQGLYKVKETPSAPEGYHQLDPDLGWSLRPNTTLWWRGEGGSYVKINSDGLRDNEHTINKPKNTIRIAVLGDSFTEAVQVELAETYWSKMEKKLNRCESLKKAGKKVEVINFGVFGYGTAQELITLRKKVWKYQPDIVLLGFFLGNDLVNNSRELEPAGYRPFYVYQNGQLVLDNSFRQSTPQALNRYGVLRIDILPSWLINNSRILQVIRKAEFESKKREAANDILANVPKNIQPPANKTWEEAWQITEDLITVMSQEVKAKNADFVLMTIGEPMQSYYDVNLSKDFLEKHQIKDLFYADKRLKALGDKQGFQVVNLAQTLQKYAQGTYTCLYGFDKQCVGHWNKEGHRLASQVVSNAICENWAKKKL